MSTTEHAGDLQPFPAIVYHPRDESGPIDVPSSALTFDGFRAWAKSDAFPDRGRFTFLNGGLIVDMSPESIEEHSDIKTEICRVVAHLVKQQQKGRFHIDGVLFSNELAGLSNEPDALYVSKESIRTGRALLVSAEGRPQSHKEIVGSVDWVLEIVSPSSVRKDKVHLRDVYFRAGVGEYWIIDALGDELEFQVLVRGANEFVNLEPEDGWFASPTFGCAFRLDRQRDGDGYWSYTLDVKRKE